MPIIVFNSTSQALLAEKALEDRGLDIDIVPLPPGFSAECGLAIRFDPLYRREVEDILKGRDIQYKGIYDLK